MISVLASKKLQTGRGRERIKKEIEVTKLLSSPLKINIFHSISWSDKSSLKGVLEDN